MLFLAVLALWCVSGLGCAGRGAGEPTVVLPPGRYPEAFTVTRDLLIARGFAVERVDARSGVITSTPKRTAGLATPWDREQATFGDEFRDVMNRHRRIVRVSFTPADLAEPESGPRSPAAVGDIESDPASPASLGVLDLRGYDGPVHARFHVTLERVHRPGFRPEPASIRLSPISEDPALRERGMWPEYAVAIDRDLALERQLAQALRRRLALPMPTPEP